MRDPTWNTKRPFITNLSNKHLLWNLVGDAIFLPGSQAHGVLSASLWPYWISTERIVPSRKTRGQRLTGKPEETDIDHDKRIKINICWPRHFLIHIMLQKYLLFASAQALIQDAGLRTDHFSWCGAHLWLFNKRLMNSHHLKFTLNYLLFNLTFFTSLTFFSISICCDCQSSEGTKPATYASRNLTPTRPYKIRITKSFAYYFVSDHGGWWETSRSEALQVPVKTSHLRPIRRQAFFQSNVLLVHTTSFYQTFFVTKNSHL